MKKIVGIMAIGATVLLVTLGLGGCQGSSVHPTIATCEDLAPHIVNMTEEHRWPYSPKILKLYDIRAIAATNAGQRLSCTANARMSYGDNATVHFHLEEDSDGDQFIGYVEVP